MRSLFVSFVLLFVLAAAGSAQRPQQGTTPAAALPAVGALEAPKEVIEGFDTIVRPFVTENCVPCHGFKKQKNGLNLEAFESVTSLTDDHERWEEVVRKLRGREMPPEEEPQPAEPKRQAVAGWLERELARIDRLTPADPGRVTARRLNRTEYNNTIRDLLGVDVHPADDFPQDDAGYGFDNIADVLSLSPVLMEKYVTAADRVARPALFGPPRPEPTLTRLRSDGRRARDARTFPGGLRRHRPEPSQRVSRHAPHPGRRRVHHPRRRSAASGRPDPSRCSVRSGSTSTQVQTLTLRPRGTAATFDDDRQDFGGQTLEFRVQAHRRRSPARGGDPADLRRPAGALQRAEPVEAAAAAAAEFSAAAERARPSGSRSCASSSRHAGGARRRSR